LGVPAVRFAPGPIPRDDRAAPPVSPLRTTAEQEAEAATLAAPIEHEEVRRTVQKAALFGLARAAESRPL
jgi:predicted component of type VI protein secretion system